MRHLDPNQEKHAVLSYGCSSYGYDLRLSSKEFLIFKHIPGTVMNPKGFNLKIGKKPAYTMMRRPIFYLPSLYGLGVALEKMKVLKILLLSVLVKHLCSFRNNSEYNTSRSRMGRHLIGI